MQVTVGDEVRLYEEGGWYYQGAVTAVDGEIVLVDFDDWVHRFRHGGFRPGHQFMRSFLVATDPGERLIEYDQGE